MLYFIIAAAVCALDQLVKLWVTLHVGEGGAVRLIPGIVHLTYLRNTGAAFSMFSSHTWVLACVSVAAMGLLSWLLVRKNLPAGEKFAVALVLGGAAGNGLDRIILHYVVDMFEVEFMRYAICNVADICINIGAILFCLLYIVRSLKEDRRRRLEKAAGGPPQAPASGGDAPSEKKDGEK